MSSHDPQLAESANTTSSPLSIADVTADRVKELLRSNEELMQLNAKLSDAQDKLMQSETLGLMVMSNAVAMIAEEIGGWLLERES